MSLIPVAEARDRNLSGHGCMTWSSGAYSNPLDRDYFLIQLNQVAHRCFADLSLGYEYSDIYLNFLKVGAGFEIYLKSVLLRKGFLIHLFKCDTERLKERFKQQKSSPIKFQEVIDEFGFQYDTDIMKCLLGGISAFTLDFRTLVTKQNYIDQLDLSAEELRLVGLYKKFRNQIHLPGDHEHLRVAQDQIYTWAWLADFIRQRIVEPTNELIRNRGANTDRLSELHFPSEVSNNPIFPFTGECRS